MTAKREPGDDGTGLETQDLQLSQGVPVDAKET